jgi:hypothetical protein
LLSKNASFEPFYTKSDHFAKTGSGQTQGKHSKKRCVFHTRCSLGLD